MAPPSNTALKPMRRGRRRKIKCTWSSATASICNECTKYSRQCIAQGYTIDSARIHKSESLLEVKVKRIESMVERLAKMQNEQAVIARRDGNGCSFERVQQSIVDGSDLEEHASTASPLFRLFNNEVITQSDAPIPPQLETTTTINFGSKENMSDLDKLKSTIAHDPTILDVVDVASEWWISWRDQQWVLRAGQADPTVRDFVQERLDSDDPVVYATGLMCVAMSLHRIRPGLDDGGLNLSAPPMKLFDRIVTAIDQVVLSRQPKGQAGVLLALQRAKTHAEGDQLRKSWLRVRHAILLSQHLNFTDDSTVPQEELIYRQRWVGGIYELDHFMSLILGFPHARDKNFSDNLAKATLLDPAVNIETKMRALRRVTAVIAGRINDHNAQGHTPDPDFTFSIAQEMTTFASVFPTEWWQPDHHLESANMQMAHEHLMTQMWFWQTSAFLHLPHMLPSEASGEQQNNQSRNLCLHSCREMLRIFCLMRGTPSLSVYICNCEDFQGVLTSAVLLVGVLLSVSRGEIPSVETLDDDFAIIDEVKEIFRYRATMQGGSISRQGLKVIETLESFLFEATQATEATEGSQDRFRSIILPYFGLIRIEAKVPPLLRTRQKLDDLAIATNVEQQYAADYPTDAVFDQNYTDLESSLFDANSHPPNNQSPSSGSHAASDDVFDKPLPPVDPSTDADFNPPLSGMEEFADLWMYGDELSKEWNLPNWHETFDAWNGIDTQVAPGQ